MMLRRSFPSATLAAAALISGTTFLWPTAAQAQAVISVQIGPPPVQRVETVPPPRQGYVWAPGHYEWVYDHYIWRRGHWVAARNGYAYIAPMWVADGPRWVYQPERWERRAPPPPRMDRRGPYPGYYGHGDPRYDNPNHRHGRGPYDGPPPRH